MHIHACMSIYRCMLRGDFGGPASSFVTIGSEDSRIYIFHRDTGDLVKVLPPSTHVHHTEAWAGSKASFDTQQKSSSETSYSPHANMLTPTKGERGRKEKRKREKEQKREKRREREQKKHAQHAGHASVVNAIAYHPFHRHFFASCSDDHTVRLWGI